MHERTARPLCQSIPPLGVQERSEGGEDTPRSSDALGGEQATRGGRIWGLGELRPGEGVVWMRLLHTSDWHLGRQLEGRSRMDEQVAVLEEISLLAREERVDLVIVAGDVFDTVNPGAEAERLFYHTLEHLSEGGRRAVLLIAGNHDHPDRLAAAGPLASHSGVVLAGRPGDLVATVGVSGHGVTWRSLGDGVLSLGLAASGEEAIIAALPYPSEARLGQMLKETLEEHALQSAYSDRVGSLFQRAAEHFREDTVNLATSHLFVRGGYETDSERPIQVGGAYTVGPEALPAGAHYVALGHLHRAQPVVGCARARYSGSPLAYSFSEAGQVKAVFLVEVQPEDGPGGAKVREIPLRTGHPLVSWEAGEGYAQALRWAEEGRDPGAWIDLELHLTEPLTIDRIQHLRELRPRLVQIRTVASGPREAVSVELRSHMGDDELFRLFYERERGVPPLDETVALFLDLVNG